jgi:hypothetical protein
MENKITVTIAIFATAAVIAGLSTLVQAINAAPSPSYPQTGYPYGGLVSSEAQNGAGGFGADIKSCRDSGGCQSNGNQGLGYIRANDASGIANPGKPGTSRDDLRSP